MSLSVSIHPLGLTIFFVGLAMLLLLSGWYGRSRRIRSPVYWVAVILGSVVVAYLLSLLVLPRVG